MTMPAICPICKGDRQHAFSATVLAKHTASYCHCPRCGFLQVEDPHWLAEAYSEAIASTDTGLVARNLANARTMTVALALSGLRNAEAVDIAGGYGLFVRLMRDSGFRFHWDDPYARNLLAEGFAAGDLAQAEAITAFEVLEHVPDPLTFLRNALARWQPRLMFLTTETYQGAPPAPGTWDYYAPDTGQHIGFFQERTLATLAQQLGLRHRRLGHIHVLATDGAIPWYLPACCRRLPRLLAPIIARSRSFTMADHHLQVARLRGTVPR